MYPKSVSDWFGKGVGESLAALKQSMPGDDDVPTKDMTKYLLDVLIPKLQHDFDPQFTTQSKANTVDSMRQATIEKQELRLQLIYRCLRERRAHVALEVKPWMIRVVVRWPVTALKCHSARVRHHTS